MRWCLPANYLCCWPGSRWCLHVSSEVQYIQDLLFFMRRARLIQAAINFKYNPQKSQLRKVPNSVLEVENKNQNTNSGSTVSYAQGRQETQYEIGTVRHFRYIAKVCCPLVGKADTCEKKMSEFKRFKIFIQYTWGAALHTQNGERQPISIHKYFFFYTKNVLR